MTAVGGGTKVGKAGNILGSARAENDALLDSAFVETAEFRSLAYTTDFHIAVGRRGTGKSALFRKLKQTYGASPKVILIDGTATEHEALAIVAALQTSCKRYAHARAVSKILWKAAILTQLAYEIAIRRNAHLASEDAWIEAHLVRWNVQAGSTYRTVASILDALPKESLEVMASHAATLGRVDELEFFVTDWLTRHGKQAIALIDRLDEGWLTEPSAVGVLGGLAVASVELSENARPIHVLAFVRDNMFRALAHYDADFSRNIEDTTLRLKWTDESLLFFVAERLRKALGITESKDIRVWDRFAHNELKGRKGFGDVLRQTLYRPRDLLTLLNRAYQVAQSGGRSEIIPADVDEAALTNSQNRLDDLVKEYEQVLPGTNNFVRAFQGTPDRVSYREALDCIARCAAQGIDDAGHTFALLGSADEVFVALYSIGFLGLEVAPGEFEYCHDGTFSSTKAIPDSQNVAIHPCYGRALGLTPSGLSVQVTQLVTDDEQPDRSAGEDEADNSAVIGRMRDQRVRQLGRVLTELDQIVPGADHAAKFEEWLYTAVRILFTGPLTNPELHPNKSAALRRDVVATNAAATGFWKRLRDDYQCRQVVFEAKNYSDLGPNEFNQAVAYGGHSYGKASFIVHRGQTGLEQHERAHIKSRYYGTQHLIVLLPAELLALCMRKQRSGRRTDHTENTLSKLLDTYERSYLGEDAGRKRSKSRRRPRARAT